MCGCLLLLVGRAGLSSGREQSRGVRRADSLPQHRSRILAMSGRSVRLDASCVLCCAGRGNGQGVQISRSEYSHQRESGESAARCSGLVRPTGRTIPTFKSSPIHTANPYEQSAHISSPRYTTVF